MTAIALTIAGSDSSGGAGIESDLKTFSALGVYGATTITAVTAQNTVAVTAIHLVPPDLIQKSMDAVFSDLRVSAVKIGMLGGARTIEAVAEGLERNRARNVVLDPVMVSTSGHRLLDPDAVDLLRTALFRRVDVITPNLPEAAALLGEETARDEAEMRDQAERLVRLGARAVVLKGGHGSGEESLDLYVDDAAEIRLPAPRIPTSHTHGSGCALSAAIAAGLAKDLPLPEAVVGAKAFVTAAIGAATLLNVGRGNGPLHHFHAFW